MQIYLPIAEQSLNLFLILGMGGAVGFLSGMFGVGGGFLMTPLLIFSGIPPAVAVATEANQIVASSVSGSIAQWRRRNVDVLTRRDWSRVHAGVFGKEDMAIIVPSSFEHIYKFRIVFGQPTRHRWRGLLGGRAGCDGRDKSRTYRQTCEHSHLRDL